MITEHLKPRPGTIELGEWFWQHVTVSLSGCWTWGGYRTKGGYGYPYVQALGANEYSHRLVYDVFVGTLTADLVIDHLCRARQKAVTS